MNEPDHLLDLPLASDAELVASVRDGDRLALGLLYLRHHEAAWRVACSVTGFSDDAEVALLDGFDAVFAALPREFGEEHAFRPYLLACVRQAGLERPATPPPSRPRAAATEASADEVVLDDDVVLSGLEHHAVRDALRRLPERRRTALWLTDVEAMTPNEVAAVLDLDPDVVPALVAEARSALRSAYAAAQREAPVRSGCRFTVDSLGAYLDGGLTRPERVHAKAHLDRCVTCRMRRSELARLSPSLIAAVPVVPLLGGECQQRWLARGRVAPGTRRALPPAQAAVAGHRPGRRRSVPLAPVMLVACLLAGTLGLPHLVTRVGPPPVRALAAPAATVQGPSPGTGPVAGAGAPSVSPPVDPAATSPARREAPESEVAGAATPPRTKPKPSPAPSDVAGPAAGAAAPTPPVADAAPTTPATTPPTVDAPAAPVPLPPPATAPPVTVDVVEDTTPFADQAAERRSARARGAEDGDRGSAEPGSDRA